MSTTRAAITAIVCAGIALALGVVGGIAIYNTTDGEVQGSDVPELSFPSTPTGMLALVDDGGRLASLVVFAIRPAGDDIDGGGSIIPIPVAADASGGLGDERLPLNETVELFGAGSLADEVSALLGVGIDEIAVLGRDDLTAMLQPLGDVSVNLPATVSVAGTGELSPREVATILAGTRPDLDGRERYATDVAIWQALATAISDGLASSLTIDAPAGSTAPDARASIGELVELLTSGPISVQALRSQPIVGLEENARGVEAVAVDRAEVAVIFGHVAPGKMAAPNAGYNFRVISPYSDEQLEGDTSRLDVAYTATKVLLADGANVLSVDTAAGEAPTETVVEVHDVTLIAAAERLGELFGPVEVDVAETRIVGVDVIVTLGTGFLAELDNLAESGSTGSTDVAPATDAAAEEDTTTMDDDT